MSESFVSNFMRAAIFITGMERALAVNTDIELVDSVNLQQSDIESERFTGIEAIQKALGSGNYVITNNLKIDPATAPTTNTNFSDLRVVVAFPLAGFGAVYLDQPLRSGMVPKEIVEKLMALAEHVMQQPSTDLSTSDLVALFKQS